jgi:hypothetical protein
MYEVYLKKLQRQYVGITIYQVEKKTKMELLTNCDSHREA